MKAIKRNWIFIIMTLSLAFSACTLKNNEEQQVENDSNIIEDDEQNSYIANPWTEVTKEDVEKGLGTEIILPNDAKNVIYRFNSSIALYEILFDYDVLSFTYRIKKSAETEDISGLYYDWKMSYEETIEGYEANIYRAVTEEDAIELITWFDSKEDISYSLSTFVGDLDGFHIEDVAKQLINKGGEDLSEEENLFDGETSSDDEADIEEMKNEIADYKNFNYAEVDTKGLSEETLNMFAPCAIYFTDGVDTANEDLLSSRDYRDICNFLFDFINYNGSELVHDFDFDPNIPTRKNRMKYEDWEYLLREVLKENNPEAVRNKLPDKFEGEVAVYYNSDDNCIYTERGTLGWEESASVREVKREGDAYIITYDLYWGGYSLWGVSEVTIAEADNKYGCSLVSVDYIKSIHDTDF